VAQKLSGFMGQPVVIDNRAGGNSVIGTDHVAKAAPDGYTLLLNPASHLTVPFFNKKMPYDAVKDFTPIIAAAYNNRCIVVHPSLPVQNLNELIAYAKKNPGKLSYGVAASGSAQELAGDLLKFTTGIDMVPVPYKGGGPALADVLGGQISMVFATPLESVPHIKPGRLRALAVTSPQRSPAMPDLPSIAETGVTGYEVTNWYGVLAPAAIRKPVLEKLNRSIVDALRTPELTERFQKDGVEPIASTPLEFQKHIHAEIAKWERVVAAAGIKAD
jgi:tripartite-type tricarboxylate transporter receptor subunit TctC